MATFEQVKAYISNLNREIMEVVPNIIAETATEYFKDSFSRKEFNGVAWTKTKQPVQRGSLMVRSGALVSSIRPSLISPDQVRISAGGPKAPYAKVHNEGGTINHPGGTAWTMIPEAQGDKVLRPVWVSNTKAAATGKKYPRTAPHQIPIPQRQFMGDSAELSQKMIDRINNLIQSLTK